MAKQILELSTTEFDRPTIVIDGETYELRPPEEFSSRMAVRQRQIGKRRDDYGSEVEGKFKLRDDLTDDEYEEFLMLGEENLRIIVVDLPESVIEKLTMGHIGMIVKAWGRLFREGAADDKAESPTS